MDPKDLLAILEKSTVTRHPDIGGTVYGYFIGVRDMIEVKHFLRQIINEKEKENEQAQRNG